MASVRGSPTSKRTVNAAIPGVDAEYTCSTPSISETICSAGVVTSDSTSRADAPGYGMKTLAKVTLICGSSSRGVTSTANRPSNRPASARSGVISVARKARAMRPEMPSRGPAGPLIPVPGGRRDCCLYAMPAAMGSVAMRSPAASPASTGTRPSAAAVPTRR